MRRVLLLVLALSLGGCPDREEVLCRNICEDRGLKYDFYAGAPPKKRCVCSKPTIGSHILPFVERD